MKIFTDLIFEEKKEIKTIEKNEDYNEIFDNLKKWIEKYGVPNSVYVDLKSVYIGTIQKVTQKQIEEASEKKGFSHFKRICEDFGIEVIKAY